MKHWLSVFLLNPVIRVWHWRISILFGGASIVMVVSGATASFGVYGNWTADCVQLGLSPSMILHHLIVSVLCFFFSTTY
ncbi:hypothetical protein R3P38DRAFT_895834 [Favolaschia claudopus]|uniref:Uncharacterized protein n=1 Tax=Favolaschia claudopus TaxID=2862362 RepID=A0AAW0BTQ8_9AGAR